MFETVEREVFGCGKVAHAHKLPFSIDELCLSVDDVGVMVGGYCFSNLLQCFQSVERIAGVEEYDVFSRGLTDTLVHGIIESAVGFRRNAHIGDSAIASQFHGVVFRLAVDDKVFVIGECLGFDTGKRSRQFVGGIESDGSS